MYLRKLVFNQDTMLDKDKMYFLLPYNLGDVFVSAQLLKTFEEKYNSKIVFILKPQQEFMMKMLGIKDYILVKFDQYDMNFLLYISNKCPRPRKGKIFVDHIYLHPDLIINYSQRKNVYDLHELSQNTKIPCYFATPEIKEELLERISKIAPIDKIVMFCPDANTVKPISSQYWENLAQKLKQEGFTVISSVMKEENTIKGTEFFEMNAEEALQVAYHCHHVYALRSGFADLCVNLGDKLTVYYPTHRDYEGCNFYDMYGKTDINEEIVCEEPYLENTPSAPVTKIYFLGIPIITIKHGNPKTFVKLFGIQLLKINKMGNNKNLFNMF